MNGLFRRRNLPHLDTPGGIYFATFCLAGSLPARGMRACHRTQAHQACHSRAGGSLHARQADDASAEFVAFDRMLDASPTVRWLADRRLADVVRQGILHGQGSRYELFAYVVMPNHCHVVFAPLSDRIGRRPAREAILHGLKRHTAFHCNRLLGRHGPWWQAESYERLVRGPGALERVVDYVERNPVRAGLCARPADWEFSSAHARPEVAEARSPRVDAVFRTPSPYSAG